MSSSSKLIVGAHGFVGTTAQPALSLHDVADTRAVERLAAASLPAHTLMERAGCAVARLALALAPHARTYWVVCGPGNNGGDGLVASRYLTLWGKHAVVTMLPPSDRHPEDARTALQDALHSGVPVQVEIPESFDCCIDALFGIGNLREMPGEYLEWLERMHHAQVPVIAVDVPSGLHADTGNTTAHHVQATHTLSLLTLKPGTFTANGRQACGEIWFDDLGCTPTSPASLELNPNRPQTIRQHNTHKGTYGDVAVIGGARGMTGAALLCAHAALRAGAGRVYLGLLDTTPQHGFSVPHELMVRAIDQLDWKHQTVVAGCGGSDAIAPYLDSVIRFASKLVLDADALNALAHSSDLKHLLTQREPGTTLLTPHPLEAARLLGTTTPAIQSDRIAAAQLLAQQFQATVVLKGSGSVIATPHHTTTINATGNALLATGGTGDVLAGMLGASLASGRASHDAACQCVFRHGQIADLWPSHAAMTAGDLVQAL